MKQQVTLGLVCLARETYDFRAAKEIYDGIIKDLRRIEAVNWLVAEPLVISPEEAHEAALTFAAGHADAIVCISGTFHLGHLVFELRKACGVCQSFPTTGARYDSTPSAE